MIQRDGHYRELRESLAGGNTTTLIIITPFGKLFIVVAIQLCFLIGLLSLEHFMVLETTYFSKII